MKLLTTKTFSMTLLMGLLLLGSCGKKENKVNTNAYGSASPISNANTLFGGTAGTLIVNQYNSLRSSISCLPGRTRLANDVSFYVNGAFTGTTVKGNWQPGFITTGIVSDMYVGVSAYRDIMFLTKVTNGGQVVGYNVTLSFCDVPNAYANYPALVSNDRALAYFQAPNGITINTATTCGYGLIAAALNTIVISQKSSSNPYTSDYPIYTSFTKPNCQ
ncbi:MAG: hypothetical protein KBD76_00630 [Bacteriovorax sp.]|nr:hypothetical protein [Bacteriovorax sp.]